MLKPDLIIVGGGLAGSEAAWQAAERGLTVWLYEMRPTVSSGAHRTSNLAELVCSNSFGSNQFDHASGILKNELRHLGSLLVGCADTAALPAGSALAVDRNTFSWLVTERLSTHSRISILREEITSIPTCPTIIATGPLTSARMSEAITTFTGREHLHFYDAIAPIITADSINMDVAYRASRYNQGDRHDGDYINCPFSKEEYLAFIQALLAAKRTELHSFEKDIEQGVNGGNQKYFEGCLPVEIMAKRSLQALAFGPMRPVGLSDPRTGRWPHALVQLRQDDLLGSLYNMVGFQTNLTYSEQKRVFHLIPGLEKAEFVSYGQMHRNTFIAAPLFLLPTLQTIARHDLFFAGQIIGVEGYIGNIATGLLAGLNASRIFFKQPPLIFPETTMIGALCHYISNANVKDFQPMKVNFGILPPLTTNPRLSKSERSHRFADRALRTLDSFMYAENLK
jgi:methylenetetrahydrofolate--tRNA-(uracil-5-)-methyltransferase